MKKLNLFFTAGYIADMDMVGLIKSVQDAGADMVEIGMPYSDPIVDGPVIQKANQKALNNGMTIPRLFEQLQGLREHVNIPVILMGYLNPVMQFGVKNFCKKAEKVGINGVIIPDLPAEYYEKEFKTIFEEHHLDFTFIVTPQTPVERVKYLDSMSNGFLYVVSDSTITGAEIDKQKRTSYFKKIKDLNLKNEFMIGFGVRNKTDFEYVTQFAHGAIIGTAFIESMGDSKEYKKRAKDFVKSIK